jgi:hypothetical protein
MSFGQLTSNSLPFDSFGARLRSVGGKTSPPEKRWTPS